MSKPTKHYLTGLKRSMQLIDDNKVTYYNIKLPDLRLAKLLQCICYQKKLHLPTFVADILKQQLSNDKDYAKYLESSHYDVTVEEIETLRIFTKPRMAAKEERNKNAKTE
jgi:hypothetical protein